MSTEPGSTTWYELEVSVDVEAVEPVVELFSRYAYNQGVAVEEPFLQDADGDNLRVDVSRPFIVRAFIPDDTYSEEVEQSIRQGLWYIGSVRPVGDLIIEKREERDWAEAWREHYVPVRVSSRFIIAPPWQPAEAEKPEDFVIELDPGMAFGTGTHPTSQLCLELLPDLVKPGNTVFDVGTGTGILAIAAAQLGAGSVDAVDIDSIAVRQATENVRHNPLDTAIKIWQSDMSSSPGKTYDLVIANIIARILVELCDAITSSVGPNGTLLLSGIIEDKEPMVVDAYETAGFVREQREQMGDWIAHVWKPRNVAEYSFKR